MTTIIEKAIKKASQSRCTYKVSAIGLNKKGEVIGSSVNMHRFSKYHGGIHAEAALIGRYGSKLKTIIICRVGRSGLIRPIEACENCKKLAYKFGIKIISIQEYI